MMVSVLNQAAVDALCSATYLEHYLDCVDDLPSDVQRIVSMLRELDCLANEVAGDVKRHYEAWHSSDMTSDSMNAYADRKRLAVTQLQRSLGRMQEIGDQKLALVAEVIERIESKTRQLEQSVENIANVGMLKEEDVNTALPVASQTRQVVQTAQSASIASSIEPANFIASPAPYKALKIEEKVELASAIKSGKRLKRHRTVQESAPLEKEDKKAEEDEKLSLRKKKVKREKTDNVLPVSHKLHVDPNEPTYCVCQQISYGEMIGCDNEQCSIEWFHFDCVRLIHKPKGKWYCPGCRGARPNIINPDLFLEQQKRSDKVASLNK